MTPTATGPWVREPRRLHQLPWSIKLERYRHLGARELVRFDPADTERPLRVWDQIDGDLVERRILHPASAASGPLGLFWVVRVEGSRRTIRLTQEAGETRLLSTPHEEATRAHLRIQELEAELAKRRE